MSINLFLYARKFTDVEDKQVLSIDAQLNELRELAAREGVHIVEELSAIAQSRLTLFALPKSGPLC